MSTAIAFILLILTMIFYILKIDSHFRYYFEKSNEKYPGLMMAYVRLSLLEKARAFIPLPVTGKDISLKRQKSILLFNFLFLLCVVAFFYIGYVSVH